MNATKNGMKTFLITSCKGGVGRSTVAANLASAIVKKEKNVLLVDCDFSNRSLDLILGCDDRVVYDVSDLATGRADATKVVLKDEQMPHLFFIPAPNFKDDTFTPDQLGDALSTAAKEYNCDYVIIDTPAALDSTIPHLAAVADCALVLTTHRPMDVRAAEKTGYILEELGICEQYLIINRLDSAGVLEGRKPGINELIDRAHIQLIGAIPESAELEEAQADGILVSGMRRDREHAEAAFDEIAGRLCGESIPLMSYLPEKKRRKILKI